MTQVGRIEIAKGEDTTLQFRVLAPETVKLSADAATGAVTLAIRPAAAALSSGDKLLFGENVVLTLSGAVAAGAVSAGVSALPGTLKQGDVGTKIRDITGYTLALEVLTRADDATPVISKSGTVTSAANGLATVSLLAADSASLSAGVYFWALWRTDSGNARPLAEGTLVLREAGRL